jgi:two-component system chemotaxis response regulator CheY
MPTVLYAEDDREHRDLMRIILRDQDFTLLEAQNGQEAIEKTAHQQPDLIVLDLLMPKIDGFGVLEAVKSNSHTHYIPVVILTAWPTKANRDRARQAGAIDFISKPYDPLELLETLKRHLDAQVSQLHSSSPANL